MLLINGSGKGSAGRVRFFGSETNAEKRSQPRELAPYCRRRESKMEIQVQNGDSD
jgi:hypothetical protein